jgi:hypothetical protein
MLILRFWEHYSRSKSFGVYVGSDVEFAPSFASSPDALATRMPCLHDPTPDALACPSDTKGQLQRNLLRTLKARTFLDPMALRAPSPPGLVARCFVIYTWGLGYVLSFA